MVIWRMRLGDEKGPLFTSQPGKKASAGIRQGEMMRDVFLRAVQTIQCADDAGDDWTDAIPESNGDKKKCPAGGAAGVTPTCHKNNTIWKPDSCQDCRCRSGIVTCEPIVCKRPRCDFQKGEALQIAPNECCPECASRAEGFCQHEGQIHSDEVMVMSPGKCCPECVPKPCSVSGRVYQGENKVQRPGKCCEECVSSRGNCLYGGTTRYHGEMWNGTRCDFCVCDEGQVTCQEAECARVECAKNGEKWEEGPCGECECRDAEVTCFLRSCPPCPLGSLAVEAKGDCCPRCEPDCHPLCRQCVANLRDTGSICLECQNARHLLLGDHCIPDCPVGYYAENGACKRCHPSCKTCTGEGPSSCSSCNASLVLSHSSACVPGCSPGYYRDDRQTCKPCNSQCLSCESAAGCTSCRDPTKVLLFGECQYESCAQQYYLDFSSKTCRECDWSCNACKGPRSTDCLQCMEGYVLHEGACVERCPAAFYKESDTCQTCPPGCLECDSDSLCHLCDSTTFLKNKICVSACGRGFYGNTWTRECEEAGKHPLSFHVNGTLAVGIGGVKPLDLSFLGARDLDGDVEELWFHMDSAPSNGRLVMAVHGKEVQLSKGDRFSCKDVKEKRVRFVHSKEKSRKGRFSLKVSDQHAFSHPEVVNIQAFSTQAPYVFRNEALLIRRGETGAITELLLGVRDSDNPQDVALVVLEPPRHGRLIKPPGDSASAVHVFHPDDLAGGLLRYAHDGSDTRDDAVLLQVNDGYHFQNVLFHVRIAPKNDGSPQLVTNSLVWVPQGGMLQISRTILHAELPGARDSEITYTIVKDQPRHGIVEHRDWPLSPVRHFTQADINHGKIAYRPPTAAPHLGEIIAFSFAGLPESVNFRFTVSDGEHTTPEMVFVIHLLSAEQQPPVFQITAPFLEVSQGGKATIGIQLAVSDTDTAPEGLFFELVKPPRHGVVLKYGAGVQERVRAGDTFTYEDVTRNALQYVHDGSAAAEDGMEISVTDGVTAVTTVLRVEVALLDNDGPQLAPGCLLAVTVASQSSVTLSRLHLAYVDNNSADSEIRIQLISLPAYGTLLRMSGSRDEGLSKVYNFTMEDINNQRISYSATFETSDQPVTDVFHFAVFDADNNRLDRQMFTVTITAAQTTPSLIAFADHITFISERNILSLVVFWFAGESFGPQSESAVTADASFSLHDVLENSVYYFQSLHESIEPTSDVFSFYVSDGFSRSEVQSINITIQRQNDEPPEMVLEPVRAREGSGLVVTNASLNLRDLDTQNSELVIVVTESPEHGHLRKRQTAAEPPQRGRALAVGSSFTYQDILDELIVYTQSGAAAQTDEFGFSVTDGLHTRTGRLEFFVEPPKKEPPALDVNGGLQLPVGSAAHLTDQHLKAAALYSDDATIRFVVKKDPSVGQLQLTKTDNPVRISVKGPVKSFTQADINKGHVLYSHKKGDPGGNFAFAFDVIDADGNKLSDQVFSISVLEDRFPPSIIANEGLVLDENSAKTITTLQLSASDRDSEPSRLRYKLTKQPQLGHLEHAASPGTRISSFSQADLASRSIRYVHTSDVEKHADAFTFSVSDGTNEVSQTFDITINPVDDSLPVVQSLGMTVQEGLRKTITEFELKATDADTEADSITLTVVQPPRHGLIERTSNGQRYHQATTFTMDDIYQNRISYSHGGSNSEKDHFTFTVSDGTNPFFVMEDGGKKVVTAAPQRFTVDILSVDDGTPRVVTNLGLQWLEYVDGKATNLITKKELLTTDPDTDDKQLIYEITTGPRNGYVENKLKPGTAVTTFTQEDVNQGLVRYVAHEEKVQETTDSFQFLVKDSKPNVVSGNIFHIRWSLLSFTRTSYFVRENAGSVSVTVRRIGNLNQYAIVLCRTEPGTATSSSGSRPGEQDYVEYAGQVQFEEREDTKACTIVINDDNVYESVESFAVELSMPAYALLGNVTRATVAITDAEDEPTLQFDRKTYHVSESDGFLSAPVERKGDTSSTVSAVCYTVPKSAKGSSLYMLESGSDFKSRGMADDSRVVFGPGVTTTTCDVTLIDDSEYEEEEEFEIVLADASDNARIGSRASANVFIGGPNDASTVFLGNATFAVSEAAGSIEIPVLRRGPDLSTPISVWCATRTSDPPSASPGIDYVPSSRKIEFRPGKTEEFCALTILDDAQYPVIEGLETFVVYLSSPHGAELAKPFQAIVAINDILQDVPSMQFTRDTYTVKEKEGTLHIPIFRTGDLSYESSVRCYTQSQTAEVTEDFVERRNAEESRITFLKGEKVKNCSVYIRDDSAFEPEEQFQVCLGSPLGNHWSGARIGKMDTATVTVTNDEDAPTIEFEEAAYQVREPPGPEGVAVINIKVVRRGDQNRTSKVRCSTRDGSAQAGVDYYPKSRMLKFSPGVNHVMFKVEIMSNEDREWHESFSLVLGPDDPVEAVLGETSTAIVTILDQEAAGSLILPAPPVVVTLADYDRVEEVTKDGAKKSPSPGYPLVCVTPCDPHFPKYAVMQERCSEAGINQSSIRFSWEVATPTDGNGARSPFETITDNTPFTSVNHKVLDSIYFSQRFHVRCVAKAVDKAGHVGTPLRSNVVTIGTDSAICHTPVVAGTARGFQAQSFIATLKYLDVKHKEHPNRIHISVQIPHQDGMLPLISTLPLHNLHFLLSESIYRHQHVCSNLVAVRDLRGVSEAGFLDEVTYDSIVLGPGYDRPYQFDPAVREPKTIQLYKHLNLKSCIWTFDAYYDMTELIDVCGGSVTADFQVRDSAQSFLTVHVPLYVSYIYVTAPRGWASLEHHTEMEFSFFYDTVLWRTGIQTDSVLSARLQIIRIYIREDGRLVIEFKTQAKFRGLFVMEHHSLPDVKSFLMTPDHLGGIEFDLQLLWSAQTFDSPYQLWRATSSYNRFLIPIAFQQTNRPVPVVYSLNTEFQLCNNEKVFLMDPTKSEMSLAEMDYKGAFSKGQILYGRVLWNPEQNLNAAYKLQLEKVYLCTGKDGYVPFFDPTGTVYNEGPQYGCIQPNKHLKHRFLLLDRNQPEVTDKYFHDVPFDAHFASDLSEFHSVSSMPGVDGFTLKVDALYKVEAGHQWYLQVIYVIGPESMAGPRVQRSLARRWKRGRRDLVDSDGRLTLDDSLIYDNEGDQIKNGTNMKSLILEREEAAVAASLSQTGASLGSAFAALTLLLLVLSGVCLLTRKCRKLRRKREAARAAPEEHPLNTKVELPRGPEKALDGRYCTVRNINVLRESGGSCEGKGRKVKQVNLEVKVHSNLHDGTEV
ncbi:extracellular matrix organizing protein FRAS1 [Grus japonensis]|uniref:Extracellular matrix organizing protein FRAS1 n=1 Tax=Grus japonensis TaxID=30415 RepID=A0ABC9WVG1_GRUJA